ncbi:HlyD family secretion protein [Sphingomonas ginkgonis]|uniref:HlyD family secretion protein n=1 Tax=Sphingomonas ginkgonis TaxID=2315330 RepID=A0A3R9YN60_9SPHN|nr:HlyD family secretion protein [Sphingomonas ginkgonis]RST31313.1 HlyD family secretion protein [Sphingomonas ginkgonis]
MNQNELDHDREASPAADDHSPEGEPAAPKISKRAKLILLVVGVVVLIAVAFWYVRHQEYGKYFQETNDAQVQADAVTVAPRVAGYVADVLVADNQDVHQGQPLLRIDPRDFRAQASQAEAQIAQAAAGSQNAQASIDEQYAMIEQARAQLTAARAKAAHDAGEVARYAPLAASGAETRQQLAQLRATAFQSAQDARAQAATLLVQQRKVAGFRAQIGQSEAQRRGAKAQLESANVNVGATLIRAAINGRVGNKTVTVGQYAQAGTRLMSIVPLDNLYIVANFKETQLALMRAGQPATIHIDALGGVELQGRVLSISPGTGGQFSILPPQNATGNFTKIVQRVPVRIALQAGPEARRLLVPGLSVSVTVDTTSAKGDLDRIREQQDRLSGSAR